MILVVGATGVLGSEICRLLTKKGEFVRALVRNTSDRAKKEVLEKMGVSLAEGDLQKRDSLNSACQGIRGVISTATSIVSRQPSDSFEATDRTGHIQLIEEAEKNGVSKFVFISFPDMSVDFPLHSAKKAVEERLQKSTMDYTILQPTYFQEVWLGPHLGFDAAQGKARIYGSGENKVSWISYRDVAKFATASLDHPFTKNKILQIGGPEALSPQQVVHTFEEIQKRKWSLEYVPEEALRQQYQNASDPTQKTFAGLMLGYANGSEVPMDEVLKKIPVDLQSVRHYAETTSA